MRTRVILAYLALTAVVLVALEVPLAISLGRRERDARATTAQRDAAAIAALSDEALEHPAGHDLAALAARYTEGTDANVTIVDRHAAVVAVANAGGDLDDRDEVERSYASEVSAALAGHPAVGRHHDDGGTRRYVATPIGTGTTINGAVLITYPSAPVERRVHRVWAGLGLLGAIVLGIASVIGLVVARSVTRPLSRLEGAAMAFGHGNLEARSDEGRGPTEVRALASTFNEMATRIGELVDAQQRFVADASHQLRSPLTALRLRLENLDDGTGSADLEGALREVHRLSRIVDGLLALARIEGKQPERRPVEIVTIVNERRAAWAPLAEERGVALVVDAPRSNGLAPTAVAIPGAVDQILDNLLANALDASPPGTAVTISVAPAADAVDLRVTDHGSGMTPDERVHAFDRFWHGRARSPNGGTGLGLAIVRQLALASGGAVGLHDTEGGGLDVRVRLQDGKRSGHDS